MIWLFLKVLYFTIVILYIALIVYDVWYAEDAYSIIPNDMTFTYKDGKEIKGKNFNSVKQPEEVVKINCSGCKLYSLDGIQRFINLTELDCSRNYLASLADKNAIHILPASLTKINCSRNYMQTLYGIESCKNLLQLDCSTNYITFITGLRELNSLQILKCSSNRLTTLYGIDMCKNIREIHCENNYISFLPLFILDFKELYDINIEGNPIEMQNVIVGTEVDNFVSKVNGKKISRVKVYNDAQNTHNSAITRAIKSSIQNILKEEPVAIESLNI